MAAIGGTAGSVLIGTVVVGGISEWSLDISHSPVEVTAFGDDWAKYVPSIRNATGSMSGNFDGANAGQDAMLDAILDATEVVLKLYTDGTHYFNVASAYVTGAGPSISQTGKAEASYSFQNSGAVTYV